MTRRMALAAMAAAMVSRGQTGAGETGVGALLSLTGGWSTLGQASRVLLETAAREINRTFQDAGVPARLRLMVEDTRLDPRACAQAAQTLAAAGARFLIGPQSSAEAEALLPVLREANMVAISHGSTASALSLAGDNLYRFVPDDVLEAEATVALMQTNGVRTVAPCWRADAGNRGLANSVRRLFTAAGGRVTAGVEYPAESPPSAETARVLASQLAEASGGQAAVYVAGFDEVAELLRAAAAAPALASLPWYGGDGSALSAALAADPVAARFAVRVGFPNATLGRPESARETWEPLAAGVRAAVKLEPDAFALAAYDACWCAMLARALSGSDDLAAWKKHMPLAADTFSGASGWGRLNANGDRASGDYDFWALRERNGAVGWTVVARYADGRVEAIA